MNGDPPESKISKNNSYWVLNMVSTEVIQVEGEFRMEKKNVSQVLNILMTARE